MLILIFSLMFSITFFYLKKSRKNFSTLVIAFYYILLNCCIAILPILYKAQEPAAKTGVNTIRSLISMLLLSP